jgi:hypothetical protein
MKMKKKNQYQLDLDKINKCIDDAPSSDLKVFLQNYSQLSSPYVQPKRFKRQVLKDTNQRKVAMIGGYPFTSKTHPWPKDETHGNSMQPIAQLDLEEVGRLLSLKLGDGLIQIWCPIDPALTQLFDPFLVRVIPKSDLIEDPLQDFPLNPVWLEKESPLDQVNEDTDLEDLMYGEPRKFLVLLYDVIRQKPIIEWSEVGQMFPFEFALRDFNIDLPPDDLDINSDIFNSLLEKITCPFNGDIYLGGYGGAAGLDSDSTYISPSKGRLLLRIPTEYSLKIGLIARLSDNGPPQFEVRSMYY